MHCALDCQNAVQQLQFHERLKGYTEARPKEPFEPIGNRNKQLIYFRVDFGIVKTLPNWVVKLGMNFG